MSSTIFMDPGDTIEARHEQRRQAARKRWPEYPAGDLETRSGYIVDRGSGLLFKPVRHVVFASGITRIIGGNRPSKSPVAAFGQVPILNPAASKASILSVGSASIGTPRPTLVAIFSSWQAAHAFS